MKKRILIAAVAVLFSVASGAFTAGAVTPADKTSFLPDKVYTIPAENGADVHAVADGEVVLAGTAYPDLGKTILIRHDKFYSVYAHLSSSGGIKVKVGDKVSDNQVIGKVGATGHATGYALYFKIVSKDEAEKIIAAKQQ